jgi:hypothetical protein
MHFVYNAVSGMNGEIIARVNSLTMTDFWTKAVVQIRQSLDPQAANVQSVMSPHNVSEITWRNAPPTIDNLGNQAPGLTGATERGTGTGPIPGWIRLVRSGNTFTSYWAVDDNGTPGPWQGALSHDTTMSGDVYVGIGLCAHANGKVATATFDHVMVTGFTPRTIDPDAVVTPAANGQAGSIFANKLVDVSNFSTTFTFQMRAGSNPIADGLTFTIQNAASGSEISESVLKLSTTGPGTSLPLADYFTPHDWKLLDNQDADLGSGGTLLLPDAVSGGKHLIVETGKTGRLYLINRDNMGTFNARYDHIEQIVTLAGAGTTPGVWGNPAFLQDGSDTGLIFYWGSSSPGKAFRITKGVISPVTASQTAVSFGFPGSQPSISSNGTDGSTAVMWALRSDNYGSAGPEVLYAYNAEDLTKLLWTSADVTGRDAIGGSSVKFTFPIVTNGHVYAQSNGSLAVYGLLPPHTTAPGAPTALAAGAVSPTQIKLTWTNPTPNDATLIKIERSTAGPNGPWTQIAQIGPDQTSYTNTGLTPLTHYWYRIRATNQAGDSDYSNTADATTPVPAAVLSVTAVTSTEVDLSWTKPAPTIDHYDLLRSTDGGPFVVLASNLPPNQITYPDQTVSRPHTYSYEVHAFNINPTSDSLSNIVTAVVAPVDINYTFPDGITSDAGLQFNGSALFSADEHIVRLNNDFGQAGSVFTTNKVSDTKWSTTFWIRLHEGTQPNPADGLTFTLQANSPTALGGAGGSLGYAGIKNSVAIKFDVYNNSGETDNSTGLFFNGDQPDVPHQPGEVNVPLDPAIVNLRDQHRKRIDISYDVATLKLNVTITDEQHDNGATSLSQTYTVDIPKVIGSDGVYVGFTGGTGGLYSLQDVLGWVFPQTVPAGPAKLQAAVSSTSVTLTWASQSTNEDGFVVERSLDNYHFDPVAVVDVGVQTYTDTNLDPPPPRVYFYRVRAFNGLGNSAYSNTAQAAVGAVIATPDYPAGFGGSQGDFQANGSAKFVNPAPDPGTIGIFTAHQDVGTTGDPGTPGTATFNNGTYTLTASGSDIWDTADHMQYLYKPMSGDGEIIARVINVNNTDYWSKAGIMIRKTLTAGSPNAFALETGGNPGFVHNEPVFQWRDNQDGGSGDTGNHVAILQPAPVWLRLVRSGTTFSAYWAQDINNGQGHGPWLDIIGNTPHVVPGIAANDPVFVGLALTAHNNSTVASATFDHVTVVTAAVLTDGGGGEAGSIFRKQQVPVTGTFSTSFVMNIRSVSGSADGLTFVLQADPNGPGALGGGGGALGYQGITKSVAVAFDLYTNGTHKSTTYLLQKGILDKSQAQDMTPAGIDFQQNHTYQVDLSYDGFSLFESIKDLVNGKTFSTSYVIDIHGTIGADTAWVGFTGATGGETAWQAVESWTATFNSIAPPPHFEQHPLYPAEKVLNGAPFVFTFNARTVNGQAFPNFAGTVHFTSSDPNASASLPGDYTFQPGDNGAHTFGAVLRTVGLQKITVTDIGKGDPLEGFSDTLTVAVNDLVHVFPPDSTPAGSDFIVWVVFTDFLGNTDPNYTGTVHFSSSDPNAILPPDYTFPLSDQGIHGAHVTLFTPGTQTITVTDVNFPGTTGTGSTQVTASDQLTVPGVVASLRVTGFPSPTVAGVPETFTVTALDAYGNVATGYTGMVAFRSSDPQALLPETYTFVPGDNGQHTFTATFGTAGPQSLTVSDTQSGASGTQDGVQVTPGAAVGMLIQVPLTPQVGVPAAVIVTAVDAYGNTGAAYTGTVHFTTSDGAAKLPLDYTFTASDNGTHVFMVTFNTIGTQSLTVADLLDAAIFGTKDDIDVVG